MIDISIIVPVYNVELYISKCIQSLLDQTSDNFEIILVDDCSPDQSTEIAKTILQGQSRIPYQIISKERNEGLSAARNTGIKYAKGSYLLFIDSDDWIEKETVRKVFESAVATKAGMIVFGIREIYDNNTVAPKIYKTLPSGVMEGKQALLELLKNKFLAHICKILFSKSSFNIIQFPIGVIYEDMLTLPYLLINEEKVCFIDDVLYNYLQRPGSITRSYDPNIVKVCGKLKDMENDLKVLLDKNQRSHLVYYVYLSYIILCHHALTLSPNYGNAKELLVTCRRSIKVIQLFLLLKERPPRSMFQFFLLKISPSVFFKKYRTRFLLSKKSLEPTERSVLEKANIPSRKKSFK